MSHLKFDDLEFGSDWRAMRDQWLEDRTWVEEYCHRDNPRFDVARFREAINAVIADAAK